MNESFVGKSYLLPSEAELISDATFDDSSGPSLAVSKLPHLLLVGKS